MTHALDYLKDRNNAQVQLALTRRCTICGQPPKTDCRHPWETNEPLGRVVHLNRVQQHMDKPKRGKE